MEHVEPKTIKIHWAEARGFDRTRYESWKELEHALDQIYMQLIDPDEGGYNKVKIEIEFENKKWAVLRVDAGKGVGCYSPFGDSVTTLISKGHCNFYATNFKPGEIDKLIPRYRGRLEKLATLVA